MDTKNLSAPLLAGLKEHLLSTKYTDLTVACGSKTWQVHKVILCSQSSFVEKACDGTFREAVGIRTYLVEDSSEAEKAMLDFLYAFDHEDMLPGADAPGPILLNLSVFKLADKYDIEQLGVLALSKIGDLARTKWNTDDFAEACEEAYTDCPDNPELRQTSNAREQIMCLSYTTFSKLRAQLSKLPK